MAELSGRNEGVSGGQRDEQGNERAAASPGDVNDAVEQDYVQGGLRIEKPEAYLPAFPVTDAIGDRGEECGGREAHDGDKRELGGAASPEPDAPGNPPREWPIRKRPGR